MDDTGPRLSGAGTGPGPAGPPPRADGRPQGRPGGDERAPVRPVQPPTAQGGPGRGRPGPHGGPHRAGANPVVPNGAGPNGMAPNGLAPNGLAPNGAGPNGLATNGGGRDSAGPNGLAPNGLAPNGGGPNGLAPNGMPPNGAGRGRAVPNGAAPNGAAPHAPAAPRSGGNVTGSSGPPTATARRPGTAPVTAAPGARPRRIDGLLDSATRPLRGWLPRSGEFPTRRLPRTDDPAEDPPTTEFTGGPKTPGRGPVLPPEPPSPAGPPPAAPSTPAGTVPGADGPDHGTDGTDDPAAPDDPAEPAPPAEAPELRPRVAWPERRGPRHPPRTLKRALLAAAASTLVPGWGHLLLRRRRVGAALLGLFVFGLALVAVLATTLPRAQLLEHLLSTRVLIAAVITCLGIGLTWMAVIVHAYVVGRPRRMRTGQRLLGATTVAALCLVVAAPLGLAAHLANSQRSLLDALFPSGGAGSAAAIGKPRLNIMLVGSDAGPDRTGTRTDTMMVASLDTKTGRTTLFGLPRNIGFARFPPGSPMAEEFPDGFHDDADPLSGDYLLNAVYAYGHSYPQLAPKGPTDDPGLNLLQSSISYMLGLPIDYQIVVDMAGFAALIDALGGLTVDVGPERIPIGGIGPHGQRVRPQGYIEPGVQQLSGEQALAFVRSRTNSTDYVRMGRQRCLIQYVLDQKSPTDLLTNFQAVARATTDSVTTNIPREVLPALVALAGDSGVALESIAFDPNLPDPDSPDGRFNTYRPDVEYMREVVREAITRPAPPPAASTTPATTLSTPSAAPADPTDDGSATKRSGATTTKRGASASVEPEPTATPESLARSC